MANNMTLLVMAAGMGSRFGGLKQIEPVGPDGQVILEYSVYDAIEAGFDKAVFIIKKEIETDFRNIIGKRIEKMVDVEYAFQEIDKIPAPFTVPEGRVKPWGTGHAVLCAREFVTSPFAVINADDYYGKEAFAKIHDFLVSDQLKPNAFCMAGFILKNTLSDNGGVTRGICKVDENGYLTDVVETSDIVKVAGGAQTKGVDVDVESLVSMNMWGLAPEFMSTLETGFEEFFKTVDANPLKAEYLLPIYIGQLLRENKVSVKVLSTKDTWFGVTYQEDKEYVVNEFKKLVEAGVYNADLFSDL